MIITATELTEDARRILNRVIDGGERVEIQRDGRTVAEIVPSGGVSRQELLRVLGKIAWTEEESHELRQAMESATGVFGYAGGD